MPHTSNRILHTADHLPHNANLKPQTIHRRTHTDHTPHTTMQNLYMTATYSVGNATLSHATSKDCNTNACPKLTMSAKPTQGMHTRSTTMRIPTVNSHRI